jgi:hypothetical protein
MNSSEKREILDIIVNDCDGILPQHEVFYITSIIYSSGLSRAGFENFITYYKGAAPPEIIFSVVQEALTHAAALSRFFWPTSKTILPQKRGERLRQAFQLDDGSPLKSRKIRNWFEHFDEKLDDFLLSYPVGNIFPTPLVHQWEKNDVPDHIFKLVCPKEKICILLGETFSFDKIESEVVAINIRAKNMFSDGRFLSRT